MTYYQRRRLYRRIYRISLAVFILVLVVGGIVLSNSEPPMTPLIVDFLATKQSAELSEAQLQNLHAVVADQQQEAPLTMRFMSHFLMRRDLFYPHIRALVLYIDGTPYLTVADYGVANQIIAALKKYDGSESEVLAVELEQEVSFRPINVNLFEFSGYDDADSVLQYIANGGVEVISYTIVKGDTLSQIAKNNNSTVERLIADNPYLNNKKYLTIGDQLVINRPEPLVTQYVRVIESRIEQISPVEEYVDNDQLYVGEKKLVEQGVPGERFLTEAVVYRNGIAIERVLQSEEILAEATNDIYYKGVKPLPPQLADSTLIRPVTAYRVTSRFGPRRLGYHSGIDLKMSIGTPVYAAEAGVVKSSGYRGGYGYLVAIDHGNGLETYYGHNSKLLVSVGQRVEKGQKISLSGNSGRSTGPHLHFEIRLNGVAVNPEKYLPF